MTHRARTDTSRDDFETPRHIYARLAQRAGGFEIDVFASRRNRLASLYLTERRDAFKCTPWHANWHLRPSRVRAFSNPPFISAAAAIALAGEQPIEVWSLVPVSTASKHWRRNVWGLVDDEHGASEVWFLTPRVPFLIEGKLPINPKTGKPSSPTFDVAVIIHRPGHRGPPRVAVWDWEADQLTYIEASTHDR